MQSIATAFDVFATNPTLSAKSLLTTLHLLGLVFGLGAATMLDLIFLRVLIDNRITREHWAIVDLLSKSVAIGLVILWISGCGFLIHYALFDPSKLANPKIWAKLSIVAILSLNGLFIHRVVLPHIHSRIGRHLFQGMSRFRMGVLIALGTISATSWYIPFVLGAVPQFNNAISASTLLLFYAFVLTAGICVAIFASRWLIPPQDSIVISRADFFALKRAARRASRGDAQAIWQAAATKSHHVLGQFARAVAPFRERPRLAAALASSVALVAIVSLFPFQQSQPKDTPLGPAPVASLQNPSVPSTARYVQDNTGARFPHFEKVAALSDGHEGWRNAVITTEEVGASSPTSVVVAPVETTATPQPTKRPSVIGVWATDSLACSPQDQRPGSLRATITSTGASGGDTKCIFKRKTSIESGWETLAACSRGDERWTANARLVVSGNRLLWSSERGKRSYVRCSIASSE